MCEAIYKFVFYFNTESRTLQYFCYYLGRKWLLNLFGKFSRRVWHHVVLLSIRTISIYCPSIRPPIVQFSQPIGLAKHADSTFCGGTKLCWYIYRPSPDNMWLLCSFFKYFFNKQSCIFSDRQPALHWVLITLVQC